MELNVLSMNSLNKFLPALRSSRPLRLISASASRNKFLPALRSSRPLRLISASAFTLVELMVVLAIIATLLLLLVPNVRTHRARARATQCQNNLRQYGIAMAQYMADWNGYFIFPGGQGGAKLGSAKFDENYTHVSLYRTVSGARSGGDRHSWYDFITLYVTNQIITADFLRSGQNSVRICPEVNREVFLPIPTNTHKGYRPLDSELWGEGELSDFEDIPTTTNAAEIIFEPYFTTYGINQLQCYKLASIIPSRVVAFIDWNAEEGWGANIVTHCWQYNGQDRHGNKVTKDTPKNGDWWQTEIGYYHPGRSNDLVANYVAMDGSVHSVSSNEISLEFFR